MYSEDEVAALVRKKARAVGSQHQLATAAKVGYAEVNAIVNGRRKPYKKVLAYLGLREVVIRAYEPVSPAPSPR